MPKNERGRKEDDEGFWGGGKGTQMDINPWKRQKRICNKVKLITEIEIA